MLLACAAFVWAPWLQAGDQTAFLIICLVTGIALGADMALPASLQADLVDADAALAGRRRAGLLFGLWGLATKLAAAIGIGLAFLALALAAAGGCGTRQDDGPSRAYLAYTRSLGRPMYVFLLLVMILLAITELGTDTWIKELMAGYW